MKSQTSARATTPSALLVPPQTTPFLAPAPGSAGRVRNASEAIPFGVAPLFTHLPNLMSPDFAGDIARAAADRRAGRRGERERKAGQIRLGGIDLVEGTERLTKRILHLERSALSDQTRKVEGLLEDLGTGRARRVLIHHPGRVVL